ncbi:A disintegrin and metalloproteinase with thrombospondin motifs adt-2-like [Haliotis rufescens]|uniref:A disintegrin and metalloproteinase with thrombospondin motifs adt-2-like n=1 Tax=Haliotis rufescens TaxID=6454 RepID=UPI00201FB0CA|nr:A disintegrin and metalloproteinase with thrombospondin motifs adt-2-like [Haliotis rufescens]
MATVILTTLLIVVAQLSILRAQYIRHTLCAQLHGGICQTSCGSPVSQQPNTIASLCTVGVCCQQADGTWSQWSAWSTCSVTCGQGERRRSRTCISGFCSGQDFQIQQCAENPCSTSAPEWGSWREWSSCSESCGSGLRVRVRTCPDNRCVGARFETQACSNDCRTTTTTQSTVSSAWASWREWESCSATCGIGFRRRDRQCDGQGCIGPNNDFDSCNDGDCSTTSTSSWSAWTEWESCSATCGIGLRRRDRQCDGQGCIGPSNDFDTCNNGECALSSRASSPANGREPTTGKNCRSMSVRALGISHVASCQENPWIVYFNLNGSIQDNPVLQPICHGVLLTDRAILTTRICGDS